MLKNNDYFKDSFFEHSLCKSSDETLLKFSIDNCLFLKESFVYIITETVAEYPYPYFTEKTWKAILTKVPFMIVGSKHSIKKLKEFGFLTFNNFWDESYDNLDNAANRCDAIVENLVTLSSFENKKLEEMYQEMMPILEHNFSILQQLEEKELSRIIDSMMK